jgi:N-formylglutamate amidohydrolase
VPVRKSGCLEPDFFTQELAEILLKNFPDNLLPFIVYGKIHRKYCDLNRPSETAFEDERMRPYHALYHSTVNKFKTQIRNLSERCLLVDVHGQSVMNDHILRGTSNRRTVERLLKEVGEKAILGPNGVLGHLALNGHKSFPDDYTEKEHPEFNGGWTVRHYGSHQPDGIDALQIEIGLNFRKEDVRKGFADALRDAVLAYHARYILDHNNNA